MPKSLEQLYGNDVQRVKIAFQSTHAEILKNLSVDRCLSVRLEVAGNENTPSEVLAILAVDKNSGVRMQVAGNINANPATISLLLNDKNQSVKEEASYSDFADNN